MFFLLFFTLALAPAAERDADQLVAWLLADGRNLDSIPFSEVVQAATGKQVMPFDPEDPGDQRVAGEIAAALDALLLEINRPDHPIHQVGRINEVSGHLEDILLEKLNARSGFAATYAPTVTGRTQRSGYPDLRLLDEPTGRIFYLDPKLYADGSERSTFRTFYYEPKVATNKITDDATHLITGIAHGGRDSAGNWIFLRWNLIDLHDFRVRLKAEFQASNRDLYRQEAIIAESTPQTIEPQISQITADE